MGIQNRDYLKDEYNAGSAGGGWNSKSAVVRLILLTVAVFVLQMLTSRGGEGSAVGDWLSLEAEPLFRTGQFWRLLTYGFCHSQMSLMHIVVNMYMLYMIGGILLGLMGDREFFWFYLTSIVFSGICSVCFYLLMGRERLGIDPMQIRVVGASGAVMAVFMLFAMHYPRQQMLFFGVVPIEVRWLLAMYVAFDLFPIIGMISGGRAKSDVAHSAHLGGLLFGFLYFRWQMNLSARWDQFAGRMPTWRRRGRNLRVFNPSSQPPGDLSEKVDAILEKISREGEASLTSRERNILTQASRQFRKERDP